METCFLEFASPNIDDGIQLCIEQGADEIHVIPIILLHAGHSKLHFPAEIRTCQVNIFQTFVLPMDKRLESMRRFSKFLNLA